MWICLKCSFCCLRCLDLSRIFSTWDQCLAWKITAEPLDSALTQQSLACPLALHCADQGQHQQAHCWRSGTGRQAQDGNPWMPSIERQARAHSRPSTRRQAQAYRMSQAVFQDFQHLGCQAHQRSRSGGLYPRCALGGVTRHNTTCVLPH